MSKTIKMEEWLDGNIYFDKEGTQIFSRKTDGQIQVIADVRAWGAIQNIFIDKKGFVDMRKAEAFQDQLGQFIAEAIQEKLDKIFNS